MFSTVPKSRMLLYLISAGLLPIILVIALFFSAERRIDTLEENLQDMQQMSLLRERKQAVNMAVRNHYRDADHFYIDKHLETLTFLETEVESLQKLLNNENLVADDVVRKRLETLTGPSNSLAFSEGVVQSTPLLHETTESLVHPVEVNSGDIQKILAKIEGIEMGGYSPSPNRPQLIVLDFKVDKKNVTDKTEVYLLNLKLLKREFL